MNAVNKSLEGLLVVSLEQAVDEAADQVLKVHQAAREHQTQLQVQPLLMQRVQMVVKTR